MEYGNEYIEYNDEIPFNPEEDFPSTHSSVNEYDSESDIDPFTSESEDVDDYTFSGDLSCEDQDRVKAILPSRTAKALAEQFLLHSKDYSEAFVGLTASTSVPEESWRWVSLQTFLVEFLEFSRISLNFLAFSRIF